MWKEYGIWQCADGGTTCTLIDVKHLALCCPGDKLVHSFMAKNWESAMQKYYKYMGWGKYNP